jgi:hypothetical protein
LRSATDNLPEVVLVPRGDDTASKRVRRLAAKGGLRFLYPGVYSSNLRAADEAVTARNWSRVASHLAPGAVVSHRSALEMAPIHGVVYLSRRSGQREFKLPGLSIKCLLSTTRGPLVATQRPGAADKPYHALYVASEARALLENLTRDKRLQPRQIPRNEVEARLERVLALRGPAGLNSLRDDAREVAERLSMESEFKELDSLVGALMGTRPAKRLRTEVALARASGRPYDAGRLSLFEAAAGQLRGYPFADIEEPAREGAPRDQFAFVESYFSNYIEGTTFTVEEAEGIVFHGRVVPDRADDSHDVLGTFEAAQRDPFYSVAPETDESFLAWLRAANLQVMRSRRDKRPGEWKEAPNQAGNTLFVLPDLVPGTLLKAWPLVATLGHPMQQALLAMFIVSEVHPFTDGNGRTARLLMNCMLSRRSQCRIVVPTLLRENHLLALKALTHQGDATAYIRVMRLCQAWSMELDYAVESRAMERQLVACHATSEDTRMDRLLSPRTGQPMAVPE